MQILILSAIILISMLGCATKPAPSSALDGAPADLKASAAALYGQYGEAVRTSRREALPRFYHPAGALRVINGNTRRLTRQGLDSMYGSTWTAPAFFAWEELEYDSIAPGQVVVTSGFRWVAAATPDTARWLYAALLEAVDSGLVSYALPVNAVTIDGNAVLQLADGADPVLAYFRGDGPAPVAG